MSNRTVVFYLKKAVSILACSGKDSASSTAMGEKES